MIERENKRLSDEAVVLKSVAGAMFSKEGGELLIKLIEGLQEG